MKTPIDHAREAAVVLNMAEIARRILIASSGEETSGSLEGQAIEDTASNLVYNDMNKRLTVGTV